MTVLQWLGARSDLLSPILVKEVRQMVRGRDFAWSFAGSLIASMAIAFFGATDALAGNTTAGRSTFIWLVSCLGVLGLAIIPMGAFSALRNERVEQTLDLMMLTALSPRRLVIGKLLAQGVRLTTLFAAIAPFVAMSFLLGGVDFVTIIVALTLLFIASLWMSALGLFLSTLLASRAMSGLVYVGIGLAVLLLLTLTRSFYLMFATFGPSGPGGTAPSWQWTVTLIVIFAAASLVNLVLLAENRLGLPTANRVTPLRVGFFVQFVLICAAALAEYDGAPSVVRRAIEGLSVSAGFHLALVAMFVATEPPGIAHAVWLRVRATRWRHPLLLMFRPGSGYGAIYVVVQMAMLLAAAHVLGATDEQFRWLLAMCGYICLFTGLPVIAIRMLYPRWSRPLYLRAAILVSLLLALVLPDVLHYFIQQPEFLSFGFGRRHLINPFRTLANWSVIEKNGWLAGPLVVVLVGGISYLSLMVNGTAIEKGHPGDAEAIPGHAEPQPRADVVS